MNMLPNKPLSRWLLIVTFLILSVIIIFLAEWNREVETKESLKRVTQTYIRAYETIYQEQKDLADIFVVMVTKFGNIPNQLSKIDKKNKNKIRNEIYDDLKGEYQHLRTLGVRQLHIHLPNNESFLRMHKPDKYGDDLTFIRPTVAYVNKHHKPIDGVEEGRIYYGLRFVYPLSKDSIHLGSIEVSFGADIIAKKLMQQHYVLSNFLIKSSVADAKNFKDKNSTYVSSCFDGYYMDKDIAAEIKKISHKDMQSLIPSIEIRKKILKMAQQESVSSLYDRETGYVFTVIPILNAIAKKNIAFLVVRSKSESLSKASQYAMTTIVLPIVILAILFSLICLLNTKRYQLEDEVAIALGKNIKQLQALQEQSKMAQMGEMLGAIAHQWRQPLNEIGTGIQNLKYDYKEGLLEDEVYVKSFIDKNKKTINFMSHTIDDFRNFFRIDEEKMEFDVSEASRSVVNMLSAQLRDHNIELDFKGEVFNFFGFESEYQQAILNIVSNAKDILIEQNITNPTIAIKVENGVVTIQDNGGGIPPELIGHIFEPYFTTKEQGKGTGMGLYVSKMIIEENMDGELSVSNGSDGAIFTIRFISKVGCENDKQ